MLQVRELCKKFGDLTAVDRLSFEVAEGETFGLLGPNGAGKSTAIHMLSGVMAPDSGEVSISGMGPPTAPAARRQIGMAPQSLSLYERLTAEENLDFFCRLYGFVRADRRRLVDEALEFAGLSDRRRDLVQNYSGGMKRRLNLAAAVIHQPQLIFMDEPTVGVDPQSRNHLFRCIEELQRQGRTILYTTHYMEEAQRLCDRVAIMDHGALLALDSVEGLIEQHGGDSLITAEFNEPPAPGALSGQIDGCHLRLQSARPFDELARLAGAGPSLRSLQVSRPDLEAVFLNLTGRSLRDQ